MTITKKFALVSFSKSQLENYNPKVIKESDDIDELEAIETNDSPTEGFTIVEKEEDGKLYDYYQGYKFDLPNY